MLELQKYFICLPFLIEQRVFIGADSNDELRMNHSFLSAGSVFNSVYISDKHSAWVETQPHFMTQGPDPCGYIWISSRAAGKLTEICGGQSGGRLGAWNRGGQTWTGYNTAINSVSLGKCNVWILKQNEAPTP